MLELSIVQRPPTNLPSSPHKPRFFFVIVFEVRSNVSYMDVHDSMYVLVYDRSPALRTAVTVTAI
ncbi:hypothetical protein E4U40_004142 [Claviceps sp. LM458 group G5]|nr:hypothetical protein E4U40_004142 [Claviceps sp. LM458 group G5]